MAGTSINDIKFDALRAAGYTGASLQDMEYAYYLDTYTTPVDFPGLRYKFLVANGLYSWEAEIAFWLAGLAPSYEAESEALFAAMGTQPDDTRKGHINTLILSLKTEGIWTISDILYGMAGHTNADSKINWKDPAAGTYNLVVVGSPTFTTDRGWAGTGLTSSYLNTSFNPTTASSPNYVQNSAHISIFTLTAGTAGETAQTIGTAGGAGAFIVNNGTVTPGRGRMRVNSTSGANSTLGYDGLGHYLAQRTASNSVKLYRNAAEIATATSASTSPANAAIHVCGNSGAGATAQVAFASAGASMTTLQISAFNTAVTTYLTAIGAL